MNIKLTFLLALLGLAACGGGGNQASGQQPTNGHSHDPYSNVYRLLDGTWQGLFYVLTDQRGQPEGAPQPKQFTEADIFALPLDTSMVIDVVQSYTSSNPQYQKVTIADTYTTPDGERKTVRSIGTNVVEDGQMICTVYKPDDTVRHAGGTNGHNTIYWQRSLPAPRLRIEYFIETVTANAYTIIGWGYYGNDNPAKPPKNWFYAKYTRTAGQLPTGMYIADPNGVFASIDMPDAPMDSIPLHPEPLLFANHIGEVGLGVQGNPDTTIRLHLTPAGARQLDKAFQNHAGKQAALIVNGQVVALIPLTQSDAYDLVNIDAQTPALAQKYFNALNAEIH